MGENVRNIVGVKVELRVSDPWDFCTLYGSGPFTANIERVQPPALLVRLDCPFNYRGEQHEYLIVQLRHSDNNVYSFREGRELLVGTTAIPTARAVGERPFDLSWWRGGLALLGSVVRKVSQV